MALLWHYIQTNGITLEDHTNKKQQLPDDRMEGETRVYKLEASCSLHQRVNNSETSRTKKFEHSRYKNITRRIRSLAEENLSRKKIMLENC